MTGTIPNQSPASQPHVLLVDDDLELLELLRDYLEKENFIVACVNNGKEGVDAALSGLYDIVVLDVMMPEINGIQALGMIRMKSNLPILMLTAKGDDTDRIMGLELGADDYVPKPCTPRELIARLRAILHRVGLQGATANQPSSNQPLTAGNLKLWPTQRRADQSDQPLELTSTEFSLLEVLVSHAGNPVSKNELSMAALDRPLSPYDRSIDVHISNIRRKLHPLDDGRSMIQTLVRKGYILVVE
ncbi:response regulator transcription factor [Candidatus Thiodiazotropha sp. CDECU1]|uniref:response regulator transcription factor n=1 Tax=Candidatus Thiodiazotropha sp. CDECU1 TaxID=3065865 RepID=UPI00292D3687|nr:response regulator transcription factor [Candidatus Thiodiazotropha sp. CDECU1]